jgi:hypothetical protein
MKLSDFDLENLFELVYEDIEYIASLTYEDANKLFSYILEISHNLNYDHYFHEFINKYQIEVEPKDEGKIKIAISGR